MSRIQTGEQFWNEDKTEGYEFIGQYVPNAPVPASAFKELGDAPPLKPMHPAPMWLASIIFRVGGIDEYRQRNNITKPNG